MKRLAVWIGLLVMLMPVLLKAQAEKPLFTIPFQLVDNRPFIEVNINGHIYHFILDTGAGNAMDKAIADTLRLALDNATMMRGANGKQVTFWMTQLDSIRIGTQRLIKPMLQVTDLSEIKQKLKLPYLDGIIGYSFMRNYAVQFDYPRQVINFYKSYTGTNGMAFSLYRGQIPRIRVQADGQPIMVTLNTGDRTAITIPGSQVEKLSIASKYKLSTQIMIDYGLGGPVNARTFVVKELKVADKTWKAVTACLLTSNTGGSAVEDIAGSLGGGVFKNYKLTIDYPAKKVYFE